MVDRKTVREIVGYTHEASIKDPASWFRLANSFHAAARLINGRIDADSRPFTLNAALSLELMLKAILAKRSIPIPSRGDGHKLQVLARIASVNLNQNQMKTLELLTEQLIWAGRYPAPNSTAAWEDYHDVIREKHVIRSSNGVMANRETFPDWRNYARIWDVCVVAFAEVE